MKKRKTNVYFYNTTIDYLEKERTVEATVTRILQNQKMLLTSSREKLNET